MARIRTIKPEFFDSEQVASVPFQWRLLFVGLWLHADREGRLQDRPQRLKAKLFPYDDLDVEEGIESLHRVGLITRYEVDGVKLIAVPEFLTHQKPNVREPESNFPPAPDQHVHARARTIPERQEGKGREGNGNGREIARAADASPAFLEFPVVSGAWSLSEALVVEFQELYPTVDVRQESRAALGWVRSNPGRRKTASGMRKFLNTWMTRATNDRGSRRAPAAVASSAPWSCPHVDRCAHRAMCESKTLIGPSKYPVKKAVAS